MIKLKEALLSYGIDISSDKLDQFKIYMDGVLEYNEHINLTAIKDKDEFIKKHYIDSLTGVFSDEFTKSSLIADVGTGAGFPGVPLAIMFPEKNFVLIDSLNKRLKIVSELCEKAGISNVKVVHGRVEDLGRNKEYREKFDLVVSRAVARLSVLSEFCIPLVKKDGFFIAYKGPGSEKEILVAKKAIKILGGEIAEIRETSFEDLSHNMIIIKKVIASPKQYPRKAGTPSKNPIE